MRQVHMSSNFFSLIGSAGLVLIAWSSLVRGNVIHYGSWWTVDGFSGLMVVLIACVYMAAVVISIRYIGHEAEERIISFYQYKLYFTLFPLFAVCMAITVLTNNSLLLWLALEGTTLFSTFLVGLYRKKTSIEAAWKYMILCSTGISLGLVGILLLSYGVHESGVHGGEMFLISTLVERAQFIPENIIKLSFIFLFIGFGTKVGLVPMHTWLPDAHSKAPSPISAIFSAVLLNIALYAIIRFKYIADASFASTEWTSHLFMIFGCVSVFLSALMMLIQTNYKRMLAYSSIEHMGLIVFAIGLSPLGAVAAVMHMIGHACAKSALFFGAGEILIRWKTTKIPNIANMSIYARYTSVLFILGVLGIIAIPPSALFMSEYGMFAQAVMLYPKTALALFVALAVIAYAMLSLTITMVFHRDEAKIDEYVKKESWNITHTVITAELVILAVLTVWFTTTNGLSVIDNIVSSFLFVK
ncbi:MAG: proton-conducting transporter membrane subunit [Parcubacteria group bacterium]